MNKLSFIIVLFVWAGTCAAQSAVSFKLLASSYHFPALNAGRSDAAKGYQFEPGGLAAFEQYLGSRTVAIRVAQGFFKESESWAGFTQLNLKYRLFARKHAISFAVGPSIFTRNISSKSTSDSDYTTGENMEYKVQWLSGEIEYAYYINTKVRFVASLNHISYDGVALAAGFKFWLPQKKDCNCPSFQKYH